MATDIHYVKVIEVDDRKREAVKYEPPGSVQIFGPALGRAGNVADRIRNRYAEFACDDGAPAAVPLDRFSKIFFRLRMKTVPLTFHQGTLQQAPAACPTESRQPCF
jgi:hypothetical protein